MEPKIQYIWPGQSPIRKRIVPNKISTILSLLSRHQPKYGKFQQLFDRFTVAIQTKNALPQDNTKRFRRYPVNKK